MLQNVRLVHRVGHRRNLRRFRPTLQEIQHEQHYILNQVNFFTRVSQSRNSCWLHYRAAVPVDLPRACYSCPHVMTPGMVVRTATLLDLNKVRLV